MILEDVTIGYTYDALDRRTSMSDSLGGTTTYAYDFEDRLTDLTAPWGTVYRFGYDGEGRRTSLTSVLSQSFVEWLRIPRDDRCRLSRLKAGA